MASMKQSKITLDDWPKHPLGSGFLAAGMVFLFLITSDTPAPMIALAIISLAAGAVGILFGVLARRSGWY